MRNYLIKNLREWTQVVLKCKQFLTIEETHRIIIFPNPVLAIPGLKGRLHVNYHNLHGEKANSLVFVHPVTSEEKIGLHLWNEYSISADKTAVST